MEEIIKSLGKFKNLEDICLQNFRTDKNFIKDTAKALKLLQGPLHEFKK